MSDRRPNVEERLARLAIEVDAEPPDLAGAVRARIANEPTPSARWPGARWAAIGAVAVVLAGGTAYAASADVRDAVRDLLGIGAVEIERVPELDEAETTLDLGERVAPEDASGAAGFDLVDSSALGEPAEAFIADVAGNPAVSFLYPSGLILSQIEGRDAVIVKQVLLSTTVEPIRVNGARGYWIAGDGHLIEFPAGTTPRVSANSLIWTHGQVTLRLEGDIGKAEALRLAEDLR